VARTFFFDGKSISPFDIWNEDSPYWMPATGEITKHQKGTELVRRVGLLHRCLEIRMNAISNLPFEIVRATGEMASVYSSESEVLPPKLGWLKVLPRFFSLIEAALCFVSQAFIFPVRSLSRDVIDLKWFAPSTIQPLWTADEGLTGFNRTLGNGLLTRRYDPNEIVYIWRQHPMSETEPFISPVQAAMIDAQILDSFNEFLLSFFRRGAIKATLLTVEGNPVKEERERLKSWWNNLMTGIRNAFATEVISASVKPVVIGEGISELRNNSLTSEKREDLVSTLGVPHSKIFSGAANYATAQEDTRTFYRETLLPDALLIAEALNTQLFNTLDLHLRFTPETMDVFQTDESERADSFAKYVGAGIRPSLAAAILGIDLPSGTKYEDLDDSNTQNPVVAQENNSRAPEESTRSTDIQRWRRKALKALAAGRSPACNFESTQITPVERAIIGAALAKARTSEEVEEAFSAQKALILRANPDDEEEEQRLIKKIEAKTAKSLAEALDKFQEGAFAEYQTLDLEANLNLHPTAEARRVATAFQSDEGIRDAVQRMLVTGTEGGVQAAVTQFDRIGFGFDWTLANIEARRWAAQHTERILETLTGTTYAGVEEALTRWIDNGEPLDALIADLEPIFGPGRAELVASTEVTRAYARGTLEGYRAAGYGETEPEQVPPAHPRCRCWITLRINQDNSAAYIWNTSADELVCPICGALSERNLGVARSS
jgi:hypothetical protein